MKITLTFVCFIVFINISYGDIINGDFSSGDLSGWDYCGGLYRGVENGYAVLQGGAEMIDGFPHTPYPAFMSQDIEVPFFVTGLRFDCKGDYPAYAVCYIKNHETGLIESAIWPSDYTLSLTQWQNILIPIPSRVWGQIIQLTFVADAPGGRLCIDNVELVPEPCTIALLSLGGLLLRRRKN